MAKLKNVVGGFIIFGLNLACASQAAVPMASQSPLDLAATVLTLSPSHLPKGLKRQKDCSDRASSICTYRAPGIAYSVDKPTNVIAIIELSRVNGRFTQALPYGLTEKSTKDDIRQLYKRLGFPLQDEKFENSLWSRGDIKIHGAENSLIYFEFSAAGVLRKAGLNGDLTTE